MDVTISVAFYVQFFTYTFLRVLLYVHMYFFTYTSLHTPRYVHFFTYLFTYTSFRTLLSVYFFTYTSLRVLLYVYFSTLLLGRANFWDKNVCHLRCIFPSSRASQFLGQQNVPFGSPNPPAKGVGGGGGWWSGLKLRTTFMDVEKHNDGRIPAIVSLEKGDNCRDPPAVVVF